MIGSKDIMMVSNKADVFGGGLAVSNCAGRWVKVS
jgi:hypothetical protein